MKYDRSVAQLVEHRSPKPGVAGSIPVAPAIYAEFIFEYGFNIVLAGMKFFKFLEQVKQEISRITWSSRKELMSFTGVILMIVTLVGVVCLGVDYVIHAVLRILLNFG